MNNAENSNENDLKIEDDDSNETVELKECIKELEIINKKIEAYEIYMKKKPLTYNGYHDIVVPHMSTQLKKVNLVNVEFEFYKCNFLC